MVGGSGFNLLCGLMNLIAKNSPTTIVPATNIPDRRFKNPPGLFMLREREGCSSIISGSSKDSSSGSDIIYSLISIPGGLRMVYLLFWIKAIRQILNCRPETEHMFCSVKAFEKEVIV